MRGQPRAHGTSAAYNKYGCRCAPCRAYKKDVNARRSRVVVPADVTDFLVEVAAKQRGVNRDVLNRRTAVAAGRDALWMEQLHESLDKVFRPGWAPRSRYEGPRAKEVERVVSVVVSDTHFQSQVDARECPTEYGAVEESRRFGKVVAQVADYKRQYRQNTRLSVKLLGDLFQNQLHDAREGAPLALQFAATLHYLVQAVLYWAKEYTSVDVHCASGNHGRNKFRHFDRGVNQKWDSIESMVYVALRAAVEASGTTNVRVHIPMTPYTIEELAGGKAFWTHGDTVLKPGYPGKDIKVAQLYHQICRWNAARHIKGPFKLFGVGHVHFGSITNMPGGVVMLTNGCLVPPDPFAVSIGAPDVTCGQYLFESTPDHIVGDQRFIDVDDADKDAGFNRFVKPFAGTL